MARVIDDVYCETECVILLLIYIIEFDESTQNHGCSNVNSSKQNQLHVQKQHPI